MGNKRYIADKFTVTGGTGLNVLVDDGTTIPIPSGGGGGATNLAYTPSATNGVVTSDTGTDATVPLADGTNAGLLKPAKYTVLENTSGTNTGDQDLSTYSLKTITVRKISTNTTLADSDNGKVILLTASCTVTLPNGLMSGFNVAFATQTGAVMTYSLGGSVTLINNLGTTMAAGLTHTIVNTGVVDEYLTVGL